MPNAIENIQPIEIPKIPISDVKNNNTFATTQKIISFEKEPSITDKKIDSKENNIYLKSILSNQIILISNYQARGQNLSAFMNKLQKN